MVEVQERSRLEICLRVRTSHVMLFLFWGVFGSALQSMAHFTDFTNHYSRGKNFGKVIERQWLLLSLGALFIHIYILPMSNQLHLTYRRMP
jgi:hypothetical protein